MKSVKLPPQGLLLLVVVSAVALNLRPFITGVAPLAARIQTSIGMDLQGVALLTLAPMVVMGVVAFFAPWLQIAFGGRRLVIAALGTLAAGSLLRLTAESAAAMVLIAAFLGLGAAVIQSIFPGMIKSLFPRQVGAVMGLYSAMLMCGGALGAQLSPLIADATGAWRMGLAWLALPALAAAALAAAFLPGSQAQGATAHGVVGQLLRRPRTWLLMACFGLLNGGYSSVVAWLAPLYQTLGWSAPASGSLLALMAASQALGALLMPALSGRNLDRRPWLWLTLAMQATGFTGLALWPTAAPIALTIIVGSGLGGCFALLMVAALDHLPVPAQAGALSALMQGGGFLLAAIPPWIVAWMHDLSGGYTTGWLLHVAAVGVIAVLFQRLSPQGYARALPLAAPAN